MNVAIWDFDGTLAHRPGGWSSAIAEAVSALVPDLSVSSDDFRPYLRSGFPWHEPGVVRSFCDAESWWSALTPLFQTGLRQVGVVEEVLNEVAAHIRTTYLDPERWSVYDDTVPTLEALSEAGWKHIILSNHVPELNVLVSRLNLERHFARIVTSGVTGVEKPHPEAFAIAVNEYPKETRFVMIGDSVSSDIEGAVAIGIPAILVRSSSAIHRSAESLHGVPSLLREAWCHDGKPEARQQDEAESGR